MWHTLDSHKTFFPLRPTKFNLRKIVAEQWEHYKTGIAIQWLLAKLSKYIRGRISIQYHISMPCIWGIALINPTLESRRTKLNIPVLFSGILLQMLSTLNHNLHSFVIFLPNLCFSLSSMLSSIPCFSGNTKGYKWPVIQEYFQPFGSTTTPYPVSKL